MRELTINYKGINIKCFKGSNYVYVNNRPFNGVISAKRFITKRENIGMLSLMKDVQREQTLKLIINQSSPFVYSARVTNHLKAVC